MYVYTYVCIYVYMCGCSCVNHSTHTRTTRLRNNLHKLMIKVAQKVTLASVVIHLSPSQYSLPIVGGSGTGVT